MLRRVQSAFSRPTLQLYSTFQPRKDREALLHIWNGEGKVYKLPFSNAETYILFHVYFRAGEGRIWGSCGRFVLGWALGFGGGFCKLLVQKKQAEKLEVVLFGNAAFI